MKHLAPLFHNTAQKAFTMIEIVMAVAVIALGLLPLLWMLASSLENTRDTMEEFIATNCATEMIETIQAIPYEKLIEVENICLNESGTLPASIKKLDLNIPEFHKGFKVFLSLKKLQLRNDLPNCENLSDEYFPKSVKKQAAIAAQPFTIEVVVEWGDKAPKDCVKLITIKGSY